MNLEKELDKLLSNHDRIPVKYILKKIKAEKEEIIKALEKLEEKEKIILEYYLDKNISFISFIRNLTYSLWFYTILFIVIIANLFVFIMPNVFPYNIFRWIFGTIIIAFVPGYLITETLFPKRSELEMMERFGFYIAISFAVVAFLGLILNYSPWLLKLEPIMITLSLFIVFLAFITLITKYYAYKQVSQ